MSHRSASTARHFVVAGTFLSVFFLMCNSASAQDKTGADDKINELKEKRLVLLPKIHKFTCQAWKAGSPKITFEQVHQAQADPVAALLDSAENKEIRIKICEEAVENAEVWEKGVVKMVDAGQQSGNRSLQAQVYLLETRIALEKAKAAVPVAKGKDRKADPEVPADVLKAQVVSAAEVYRLRLEGYRGGEPNSDLESTYLWSVRWLNAERDLSKKPNDRVAAAAAHLERMKTVEAMAAARVKGGNAPRHHAAAAEFFRVEAQIWLARAKDK
jgi:hypothetical protein